MFFLQFVSLCCNSCSTHVLPLLCFMVMILLMTKMLFFSILNSIFSLLFEQEALHFHFVTGPKNHVAGLSCDIEVATLRNRNKQEQQSESVRRSSFKKPGSGTFCKTFILCFQCAECRNGAETVTQ